LPNFGGSSANLQKIGPRIKITPHLNDSDEVRLDVDEQISDIQSVPEKGNTYGSVTFIERSATTTLTVKDEETVVIAGLVRDRTARSETKVPVLGDIPLLGVLFRSSSQQVQKSNLVLVLTPHIIRDRADRQRIFQRKMDERQEMIDHAAVFSDIKWEPPKDYAHTRGLLAEIRKQYAEVDEKRVLEGMRASREMKTHTPQEARELPTPLQTWGASAEPAHAAPAPTGKPVLEK